jgi:uncharacterized protein
VPIPILVDTLFVVALINPRDQYHQKAVELSEVFEGHRLLVTDAILLEIGNALARGYRTEAAQVIEQFLDSEEVDLVRLDPDLFGRALRLYKRHDDKFWGLVDCLSFLVMKERGMEEALTFDRHFPQAGFRALMRDEAQA